MSTIPKRLDPQHLGRMLTKAEADERVALTMTERQLEAAVAARAATYGYLRYHTYRSDRSPAGFPDDVLVRASDGRLLFLELKIQRGRTSPGQVEWLNALDAAVAGTGVVADGRPRMVARIIRPSDLLDGTLDRLLA